MSDFIYVRCVKREGLGSIKGSKCLCCDGKGKNEFRIKYKYENKTQELEKMNEETKIEEEVNYELCVNANGLILSRSLKLKKMDIMNLKRQINDFVVFSVKEGDVVALFKSCDFVSLMPV